MHNRIAALGRYGDPHRPNAALRYNDALGLPRSFHHAQGCTLYALCAGGRWIERKPDIFYSEFREGFARYANPGLLHIFGGRQ